MDIELYKDLINRKESDYELLLTELMGTRVVDKYQTMVKPKDRGGMNGDYYQEYTYDTSEAISIINRLIIEGRWFKSLYLSWVTYEIKVKTEDLMLNFDTFIRLVQSRTYGKILERNCYECYGYAKIAFTILDKIFVARAKTECNILFFLKLALEGACSYTYYHHGKNKLWDTEIYASYARMFDIFKAEMTVLWFEFDLGSYVSYSYIYGMHQAFLCAPYETDNNYDYRMNANMMAQNQSVAAVTDDAIDVKYDEALQIAERQYQLVCSKILQNSLIGNEDKWKIKLELSCINSIYNNNLLQNPNICNIRYFAQFYQLEPYSKVGFIRKPYKRISINYRQLLKNLNITNSYTPSINQSGVLYIEIKDMEIYPYYYTEHASLGKDSAKIFSIYIELHPNKDLKSMIICGYKLHAQYVDVQRSGLFYDIPCIAMNYMHYPMVDQLFLHIGTTHDYNNSFQ